ncbi:TPA: hypothetical protein ACXR6N_000742 [Streptococcus pneumoniae]|nr:hypothetical protein [Streptococcus pneumoniae]HEW1090611.1 hypothetical protein [Streptococcus pneumoniae]HEW1835688.1 hypothetical protein [Streptococcus pneumoniae]HEW5152963.1 hypothetical protein [Streptococcus pneumoniae]HEW5317698.1 hypothetical protein [Streptococcus pneumoniae]
MRFYCEAYEVITEEKKVYFNDIELEVKYSSVEELFIICEKLLDKKKVSFFYVDEKPLRYLLFDYIFLLVLAKKNIPILDGVSNKQVDPTLLHHFSLEIEKNFIDFCYKNMDLILKTQSISLCHREELIIVDVSDDSKFGVFYKRFRTLVDKSNGKYVCVYNFSRVSDILQNWKNYCNRKFSVTFTESQFELFKLLYNQKNFKTISLLFGKKIVAGGIIYYSDLTNIEYFCIFWWDSMFGKDSIGKYVYVEEISRCHFLDRNYSFCYGLQYYKSKLIKYFLE